MALEILPKSKILINELVQDELANDPQNHGATFCPIILGSDKTTVSVATGQNEYYPLYMSNSLVQNNVRRAHRNALTLISFLAIPKSRSTIFEYSIYLVN
jgi:Plavaka transposase